MKLFMLKNWNLEILGFFRSKSFYDHVAINDDQLEDGGVIMLILIKFLDDEHCKCDFSPLQCCERCGLTGSKVVQAAIISTVVQFQSRFTYRCTMCNSTYPQPKNCSASLALSLHIHAQLHTVLHSTFWFGKKLHFWFHLSCIPLTLSLSQLCQTFTFGPVPLESVSLICRTLYLSRCNIFSFNLLIALQLKLFSSSPWYVESYKIDFKVCT